MSSSSSSGKPFKPSCLYKPPRKWLPPVQVAVGEPKAPPNLLPELKELAMSARGLPGETPDAHYYFVQKFQQVKNAVDDNEANLILFLDAGDDDKACLDIINKAKPKGIPWLFLKKNDYLNVQGVELEKVCCIRRDYFFNLDHMEKIRGQASVLCGIQSTVAP